MEQEQPTTTRGSSNRQQQQNPNTFTTNTNSDTQFFDANEEPSTTEMNFEQVLDQAQLAMNYFFDNKFEQARNLMIPYARTSMYHSIILAIFSFFEALMTLEQELIAHANSDLNMCFDVCSSCRRKKTVKQTVLRFFGYSNPTKLQLTDLEAHAELCTAEVLLLQTLLSFFEDESTMGLIQGGFRLRKCFHMYKSCAEILELNEWNSIKSQSNFESGVLMGMGMFKIVLSILPPNVVRMLEFIGISCEKATGLRDLKRARHLGGVRHGIASIALLFYHLFLCHMFGYRECDLDYCSNVLQKEMIQYPNGFMMLFLKARLHFVRGDLDVAEHFYKLSWHSQNSWKQFHTLCCWELFWLYCVQQNWSEAKELATRLIEQSSWSRTSYLYNKAAVMITMMASSPSPTLNALNDINAIEQLMLQVPYHTRKIGGKTPSMERFAVKKAQRYEAQGGILCLPAIELMYFWNMFKVLGKRPDLAAKVYKVIERQRNELHDYADHESHTRSQFLSEAAAAYANDNRALCHLLGGACLRQMKEYLLAIHELETCIALQSSICEDTFLIPYAQVEIGFIHADEGHTDLAMTTLENTRKNYSDFMMESRLNFRIHTTLLELREQEARRKSEAEVANSNNSVE